MRPRGALQANDLLDIVDFIKNEDKYTSRINELKSHEAALAEKMGIVRTLEAAQTMQDKAILVEAKLAEDRRFFTAEMDTLRDVQKQEHKEKLLQVEKRLAELARMKSDLGQQLSQAEEARKRVVEDRRKLDEEKTRVTQRYNELEQSRLKWQAKLAQFQQLMSG